jgi:hypothetical protein
MLSFPIGRWATDIQVWHYNGIAWTAYTPAMPTYDNTTGIVDFTVNGFSGYAVSATPEPATLGLLAIGGLAMLRRRRAAASRT